MWNWKESKEQERKNKGRLDPNLFPFTKEICAVTYVKVD